ncbi:uncharacterized protein LACBIDRAFT_326070 [Laccaria bicolor S238N-H82]|uniref:Predicted protein n=1 Tax=Laccaria bicolor (strain S238N-H82 / ATCC MYA-4686) TaxID=486041 RepID=B0D772_LACBS|nr:uncharacterized protein LACBIDRAFT_326070 [Laccaria bicolor S238N-H82]EDR09347.1 predicted protein [Laccaria bicolor S238N-H82]|eukprot:XP_001879696.1 predicted protein [Laccaria bicolor S238N-H82]
MSSLSAVAAIKLDYWDGRPVLPTDNDFQELRGEVHFADTVDKVALIQARLKLKDAWIWTMNIVIHEGSEAVSEQWLSEVPFAADNVMGAWINGAKENKVYWLLKHKIPCFIIHEVPTRDMYLHFEDHKNPDFVAQTDAQYLVQEHNGFDNLAYRHKALINAIAGQEGLPRALPDLSEEERSGSDPRNQGWDGVKHRLLEETPEVVMKQCRPPASDRSNPSTQLPPKSSSIASIPDPEVRSLAREQVEWIVPPPVMAVTPGRWTFWKEEDLDRNTSCFCPVSSRPEDCEQVYYDRVKRRELFTIENLEVLPGAISDVKLFGFPAPEARFVELKEGNEGPVIINEYDVSHWLYLSANAKKGTVGQRASTPPPTALPLRSTLLKSGNNAPSQTTKSTPPRPAPSPPQSLAAPMNIAPPQKPVPTEPRAHRQRISPIPSESTVLSGESALGHISQLKKARSIGPHPDLAKGLPVPATPLPPSSSSALTSSGTPLPNTSSSASVSVNTLTNHSADSRFLCFEGLPFEWEECLAWFYGMAVSSHFVWINQIYRTVSDSRPLIWLDMKSNEDTCMMRGFLTHQTTERDENALVISHFVSEATFEEAVQCHTHKWERPPAAPQTIVDDPMEGPSQPAPLEMWLTSLARLSPAPDVTLLHRAGVTLEDCLLRLYITREPYTRVLYHLAIILLCLSTDPCIMRALELATFINMSSRLSILSSAHSHGCMGYFITDLIGNFI